MGKYIEQEPGETCSHDNTIMVQYRYDHPEHYDGVSEIRCQDCGKRVGRWTGKILEDGESEKRFGED